MEDVKRKQSKKEFVSSLYEEHYKRLVLYCMGKLQDVDHRGELAELCAQATIEKAMKAHSTLRKHPNLIGWLYKTAQHQTSNELAKARRRAKRLSYSLDAEGSPVAVEPDDPIEEYADRQADQELICELYSKLNSKQKEILSDRFNEELSYERISEKRGIPIGTAKSIIWLHATISDRKLRRPPGRKL